MKNAPDEKKQENETEIEASPQSTPLSDEIDTETLKAQIIEILNRIHLGGMRAKLEELMETLPAERMAPFISIFALIAVAEDNVRNTNKQNRLLRAADLHLPNACMEDVEAVEGRHFDVDLLHQLSTCEYIRDHRHVIVTGATGCGKTYISNALATKACRKGFRVKYIRLPDLLNESDAARKNATYSKFRSTYTRQNLIVIDEWLLRPLSYEESLSLLDFIDACSNSCSLIFCSQFPVKDWYTRIDGDRDANTASTLAEAVLDRIIHNAYSLHISSNASMRKHYGLH
ncbi:MAG: ATP-binding protein [Clostridia bacterium]|nr:ATP-binding protein [Clostridia bacterium]